MKLIYSICFFTLLFITSILYAEPLDESKEIEILNTQSIEKLGVSLRALSAFIEYSDKTFSECYMRATGNFGHIEELVSADYVTIENQKPIEGLEGQQFSKLLLTGKGQCILTQLNSHKKLTQTKNKSCM